MAPLSQSKGFTEISFVLLLSSSLSLLISPPPTRAHQCSPKTHLFPLCIKITCFAETQGAKVLVMSLLGNIQVIVSTLQIRKLSSMASLMNIHEGAPPPKKTKKMYSKVRFKCYHPNDPRITFSLPWSVKSSLCKWPGQISQQENRPGIKLDVVPSGTSCG